MTEQTAEQARIVIALTRMGPMSVLALKRIVHDIAKYQGCGEDEIAAMLANVLAERLLPNEEPTE